MPYRHSWEKYSGEPLGTNSWIFQHLTSSVYCRLTDGHPRSVMPSKSSPVVTKDSLGVMSLTPGRGRDTRPANDARQSCIVGVPSQPQSPRSQDRRISSYERELPMPGKRVGIRVQP